MNKLLLGAAYYPEYEPYERTEKDLRMMQEAGINVVRMAESTWSTWEPKDGEYDFSILMRTLNLCEKEGMQVIIGTPTYAVPSWLVKKDPKVMVMGKNGRRRYGARQIMDIMNPTYREHAERIIRKLCELTRNYDCVIGYQLDNETKHYGTSGGHVRKLFKAYLKEIFGTVEAMNEAFGFAYWSNSIADWDDLPDVRGTINGSYACEFEYFQRKLAADFLMWQRGIVDEYRRADQFVTHNLDFYWKADPRLAADGYSCGVQDGINHYSAAKALTVAGTDIYHPTQEHLSGAEIAFGGDSIRPLKDKQYFVLETEAQAFPNWTPFPGQLTLQAFSHLASGARMVEYWHWHSIHNSKETYWKGILSHDMEENRLYREVRQIGTAFEKLSPYLEGYSKKNRVAILVDNRSLSALNAFPIADGIAYNDVVTEYHRALYEQNIECDILDVFAVTDAVLKGEYDKGNRKSLARKEVNPLLGRYDTVIVPVLYTSSDLLIDELRTFTSEGGTLIAGFKSFFTDMHVKVRAERQPCHMTDVFGMSYQEFTVPGTCTVRGLPVRGFMELLMPDGCETIEPYEHRYWGEYAAVTKHCFGNGTAWYIGAFVDFTVLKDLFRTAIPENSHAGSYNGQEKTFFGKWKTTAGEIPVWPLIVRQGINSRRENVTFLLNYSEEERELVCPCAVKDVLMEKTYMKGDTVTLKDWGAAVLLSESL